jgi:precorrin-6B C5,15-methyltransferase / cobalt-precorrin-6B C5,C15-methyltransferase
MGDRSMITVIGLDGSPLSARATRAVQGATLLAGGRRHLASVAAPPGARTVVLGELRPALDALAAHRGDAVVLASGDPGFFGVVRALRARGLAPEVLPAVSSVAQAFARAGLPWDDAVVVSAHGRDLRQAANVCRAYPKVAVLTGPGAGPAEIGAAVDGWERRLVVCESLGLDSEQVTECSPPQASARPWRDPNVVLVLAPCPPFVIKDLVSPAQPRSLDHGGGAGWMWPRPPAAGAGPAGWGVHEAGGAAGPAPGASPSTSAPLTAGAPPAPGVPSTPSAPPTQGAGGAPGWALGEEWFDSRDCVITKAEVRALALARLAPGPGTLVWDVGAGAGSVAVECARFGAAVVAVERDALRCARIRDNARRHGTDIRVVTGEAPGALAGLPAPDAVFVGGGGPAVWRAVAAARPARIVLALAAVERAGQAGAVLREAGYPADGSLVQASRLRPLPDGAHRLAPVNPVFVLWATLPARHAIDSRRARGDEPAAPAAERAAGTATTAAEGIAGTDTAAAERAAGADTAAGGGPPGTDITAANGAAGTDTAAGGQALGEDTTAGGRATGTGTAAAGRPPGTGTAAGGRAAGTDTTASGGAR